MKALEHKIPPPLTVLIMAVMMWVAAHFLPMNSFLFAWRYAAFIIFTAVGLTFAVPAFLAFRHAKTTINPVHINRTSTFVTTGIYRYTRNPMYVGLLALLCGWAWFLAVPWLFIVPPLFVLFTNRFQIIPEERILTLKFSQEYMSYQKRVRRWL
jgi:protein-S-isoprenylcysteine O-methyltransferase Ste14